MRHGRDPGQGEGMEGARSRVGWDSDCLTGGLPSMGPAVMGPGTVFLLLDLRYSVLFLSMENPAFFTLSNWLLPIH